MAVPMAPRSPVWLDPEVKAVAGTGVIDTGANHDNDTWGYQERWAEYRYFPNKISGQFRSQAATPLDSWHFAQNYGSQPGLNSTFLPDDSATVVDRNLGVTHSATVMQFKLDIYNKYHHARVMPVKSVPGIARL